jgi:hypothetical protein
LSAQMDYLDAPLQKDSARARLAVFGSPRVVAGVSFAIARRAAERDAAAAPLVLCRRRDDAEAPPPPLRDEADAPPTTAFRGHAEGPALDRVRLKYVAGLADVAWILNNCQSWPGDHARPTLIIIDDVAALSTTEGAWDAAALHRLAILAKLADAAATFLECGCVLAVSGAPETARVVLKRHFPRTRCLDDGVLRGAGERPRAKIRDDGVRGIVLCE